MQQRTRIRRASAARIWNTFIAFSAIIVAVVLASATAATAQGGRPLTSDDWEDRIPIVFGAIAVVLIVNSIGLYFIARSRRNERSADKA